MQNSRTLEAKHIRQLIQRDKDNRNQVDQYFIDAMTVISQHLNEFYKEYSDDTGLSLSQVSKSVNQWDIQHYAQAVSTLLGDNQPDSQLHKKLQWLQAKALSDKRSMLGSIVSSGIAIAAFRTKQYAKNELPKQYFNELNYRSPQTILNGVNQPKSVDENQTEFENRLQVHADVASTRANETLNAAIAGGLNQSGIDRLTKVQSQQDKRLNKNISSTANNLVSAMIGALNYQAINNTTQGANDAYKSVDQLNSKIEVGKTWQTQEDDRVCNKCAPLDGTSYSIATCPIPQIDTHNGCRCTLSYCNLATGELLDVYPDE